MDSILTSVKKMLGITEEYDHFDSDIMMHINTVLMTLKQLGIGPEEGFIVDSVGDNWDDFLPKGKMLEAVKSYMYMKVKLLFDPPTSSIVMDAMNRAIAELEWRLNVEAES